MASDSGVPNERLDERLAAARDSALRKGEEIVAQVEGDHGQAIVLTNSRVLVIKVGMTATGVANGKVVGEFRLPQITAVNVRKGPLGAVIQICTKNKASAAPSAAPDNVVVFTGSQRMRRCESIAARIESATGKPVGRVESPEDETGEAAIPAPAEASLEAPATEQTQAAAEAADASPEGAEAAVENAEAAIETTEATVEAAESPAETPRTPEPAISDVARGTHQPRSLAEEMFAEVARPHRPEAEPVAAAIRSDTARELEERSTDGGTELHPNPNLPKPVHRHSGGRRVLVLFGALAAVLLIGVAAMVPIRMAEKAPAVTVSWSEVTSKTRLLRRQRDAVARYAGQARAVLNGANRTLAALESALRSNSKAALTTAVQHSVLDPAWRALDGLDAPAGLAGSKEQIVSGLFVGRTAVANLSSMLRSSSPVEARDFLAKIAEARSAIDKGLASIDKARQDLERQLAENSSPPKR